MGWISVEDRLPEEDGIYDCLWHCGSMSPYTREEPCWFRKGRFSRRDWNYVTHWKPKK